MEKIVDGFVEILWKTKQVFFKFDVRSMARDCYLSQGVNAANVSISKVVNLFSFSIKKRAMKKRTHRRVCVRFCFFFGRRNYAVFASSSGAPSAYTLINFPL